LSRSADKYHLLSHPATRSHKASIVRGLHLSYAPHNVDAGHQSGGEQEIFLVASRQLRPSPWRLTDAADNDSAFDTIDSRQAGYLSGFRFVENFEKADPETLVQPADITQHVRGHRRKILQSPRNLGVGQDKATSADVEVLVLCHGVVPEADLEKELIGPSSKIPDDLMLRVSSILARQGQEVAPVTRWK
jgi:hypothetical protein